jgi:hypothetical protein
MRQKIFLVGGEQTLDALLQAAEITLKRHFSTFCRVGVTRRLQPAVELVLDQAGILKQFEDLGPDNRVEPILADRATMANRSAEPTPRIGTQTPIGSVYRPSTTNCLRLAQSVGHDDGPVSAASLSNDICKIIGDAAHLFGYC